jgi:peptidyl-prolyl cis-trans isomerase SurA
MNFSWTRNLTLMTCLGFFGLNPAQAQNLFAPAILVNDVAITGYELQQRQLFLEVLNTPGDHAADARSSLIEDRLKQQATRSAGLGNLTEVIEAGMEEFAGRANLTKEEFVAELEKLDVSEETFRDFVAVSITWRELINIRYGRQVEISEAEIDRALQASGATGVRVLISELIMPTPVDQIDIVMERAERISKIKSIDAFAEEARQYSATATRDQGGVLDWMPITDLPPVLRPQLLSLAIGDVTAPIPIPNAVALFQLRGIQETSVPSPTYSAIDYAIYLIPGGKSEAALAQAAKVRSEVDVCDDLNGQAYGQAEAVLTRNSQKPSEIPSNIAIELAKLDDREMSTALTTADGQTLMLLMLCGRTATINEDLTRDDIAASLRQRRINAFSQSYLDQLLADARIVEK